MRQITAFALVAGLSLSVLPLAAAQVAGAFQTAIGGTVPNPAQAVISGNVVCLGGQPLANIVVQARNLLTGALDSSTSTAAAGQFALNVNPEGYVLEIVDAGGQIVGVSSSIFVGAGAAVTGVTVTATSCVLGVVTDATGLAATLGATASAPRVMLAAAAAGVVGVLAPPAVPIASPSR